MADRYLRANGNWNGSVWAATSSGTAGSAATPTSTDTVYIAANFTVTLTADAECYMMNHTNGVLTLSSYRLTTMFDFKSTGSTVRRINLNSGILEVNGYGYFTLNGSNLTFNAGESLIILNVDAYSVGEFATSDKIFNNVRINIGVNDIGSSELVVTGSSPDFHTLDIRSANSASHTIIFDDSADVSIDKLVLIGASSANKLYIGDGLSIAYFGIAGTDGLGGYGSVYGQYIAMDMRCYYTAGSDNTPPYIGSNSTKTSGQWILQDPPKISTLVDALTTSPESNPNWIAEGTITTRTDGSGGGGYTGSGGGSVHTALTSVNTFDLVDSSIIIERPPQSIIGDTTFEITGLGDRSGSVDNIAGNVGAFLNSMPYGGTLELAYLVDYPTGGAGVDAFEYPNSSSKYLRLSLSSSTNSLKWEISDNGSSWTTVLAAELEASSIAYMRSVRIVGNWSGGTSAIGSINMLPTPASSGNFFQFF